MSEDNRRFPRRNPKLQYSSGFPEYCCAWVEKRDYSPFEHRLKVHGPIFEEQIRNYNAKRLGFSRKPSKHLTVFSPETVNTKKLANLTANTKNYRQITLNTKPHSDPLTSPEMNMSRNVFVAVTDARSRTDFYFSQRLRQQQNCATCSFQGMLH